MCKMLPFKAGLVTLLSLSLMSCVSLKPQTPPTETTVEVKPDCVNWQTLTYSAKGDTETTVRGIISNNTRWALACKRP